MTATPNINQIELTDVDVSSARGGLESQLDAVNWQVREGDFWVIGGAHASGKSDLLATAAGMQRPLRGTVRLFGREIDGLSEKELLELRLGIGMVFKNGGRLFNQLTLAENIALPLRYRFNWTAEQAAEPVEALLRLTELADRAHTTPPMLPANWLQRIALARALALKPRVLLLDEPMGGLEARQRRWWEDFLERLSAGEPELGGQPITLVVVTTDLTPWTAFGRQFAMINHKRWTPIGGREELKRFIAEDVRVEI